MSKLSYIIENIDNLIANSNTSRLKRNLIQESPSYTNTNETFKLGEYNFLSSSHTILNNNRLWYYDKSPSKKGYKYLLFIQLFGQLRLTKIESQNNLYTGSGAIYEIIGDKIELLFSLMKKVDSTNNEYVLFLSSKLEKNYKRLYTQLKKHHIDDFLKEGLKLILMDNIHNEFFLKPLVSPLFENREGIEDYEKDLNKIIHGE